MKHAHNVMNATTSKVTGSTTFKPYFFKNSTTGANLTAAADAAAPLWLAGCCAACALACLIRNNSLILLIAFVLVLAVTALGEKRLRPILAAALLVAVFVGSRFALYTVY